MIIQGALSALNFVWAGNCADRHDYERARVHIQRAMQAAGYGLKKPGLFEYFIRAAQIEEHLGNADAACIYIKGAAERISSYRLLSEHDRKYLLDYADVFVAEMRQAALPSLRLTLHEHAKVTARYRREYPLERAPS